MSLNPALANFDVQDALQIVVSSGIGLWGLWQFGPEVSSAIGAQGDMAVFAINTLVLSFFTYIGRVVAGAVLAR